MFLAYASEKGAAFIDRALYMPKGWANDPKRRAEAGVPEKIIFENKVELAKGMLKRAFEAGIPKRASQRAGGGGFVLRPLASLTGLAGGTGTTLRGHGPQDQRRPARRAQEDRWSNSSSDCPRMPGRRCAPCGTAAALRPRTAQVML